MEDKLETRRLNEEFDIELEHLIDIVEHYRNRKF